MKCSKCGYENQFNTDICPKCGSRYKRRKNEKKSYDKENGNIKNDKLIIGLYIIGIVLTLIFLIMVTIIITNYKSKPNTADTGDTVVAADTSDEISTDGFGMTESSNNSVKDTTKAEESNSEKVTSNTSADSTTKYHETSKAPDTTKNQSNFETTNAPVTSAPDTQVPVDTTLPADTEPPEDIETSYVTQSPDTSQTQEIEIDIEG